jgi:hypothetical protein
VVEASNTILKNPKKSRQPRKKEKQQKRMNFNSSQERKHDQT